MSQTENQPTPQQVMANTADHLALRQKYDEAIEYLDSNFAFFLTHVLNMGEPTWDPGIPTACVALPKDIKDISQFKYLFNPVFADKVLQDNEELAFVMAHETMHVLLNHLKLAQKFKGEEQKFNIAADCVINDYLVSMGLRAPDGLMMGEKVVGYNCANSTVSEVFKDVPDQPQDGGTCDGNCQGSSNGQGGNGTCTCPPDKFKSIDDHDWMHNPQAGQQQAADDIAKDTEANEGIPQDVKDTKADDDRASTLGSPAGDGTGGVKSWAEKKGVSMKWAELLRRVNPDIFNQGPKPRPSYRKPRRKLMGVMQQNPDINLPIFEDKGKRIGGDMPVIVMALDTSGSCAHYADDFIALAKSVPNNLVKLLPMTFTTQAMELDLENPNYRGGGTEFGCIENFIQSQIKSQLKGHYPKAVVVVTDGAASFTQATVDAKHKDNWTWLITDWQHNQNYYTQALTSGGFKNIEDLSKFSEGIDKTKP